MTTAASPGEPPMASPLLETGMQLTREEFHHRFEAMPNLRKAELLEGVVYVPSPTGSPEHASPHMNLATWLGHYQVQTPGVQGAIEPTVRLGPASEPQPDAALFIDSTLGGRAHIDADHYLSGPPELVAQIAASTVDVDLGPRREAYRRAGVAEYVVWRVTDRALDWFILRANRYEPLQPVAGVLQSEALPGLWLEAAALLRGDMVTVLRVLGRGLASPEHDAFVAQLRQRAPGHT